jgi:hypothetical protein
MYTIMGRQVGSHVVRYPNGHPKSSTPYPGSFACLRALSLLCPAILSFVALAGVSLIEVR